jgi:hypothetical protein
MLKAFDTHVIHSLPLLDSQKHKKLNNIFLLLFMHEKFKNEEKLRNYVKVFYYSKVEKFAEMKNNEKKITRRLPALVNCCAGRKRRFPRLL